MLINAIIFLLLAKFLAEAFGKNFHGRGEHEEE